VRRFRSWQIARGLVMLAAISAGMTVGGRAWGGDPANARPKAASEDREVVGPVTEKSFYGWQILVTGGLGGALVAASMVLPERPFSAGPWAVAGFTVGLPFYVFGGPAVHWTHGNFSKGLLSIGANVAIPLAAGIVGAAVAHDDRTPGFARGAAVGVLVAPVLDALIWGWEDVPVDTATGQPRRSTSATVFPAIDLCPKGGVVWGVRGAF
jgi:hypothetical protein